MASLLDHIEICSGAGNVLRSDAEKLIANLPEPRKHRNQKGMEFSGQDLSLHLQMVIVVIQACLIFEEQYNINISII